MDNSSFPVATYLANAGDGNPKCLQASMVFGGVATYLANAGDGNTEKFRPKYFIRVATYLANAGDGNQCIGCQGHAIDVATYLANAGDGNSRTLVTFTGPRLQPTSPMQAIETGV